MGQFIAYSIGVFLILILLLVIILLVAKKYLSPSGNVNIEINGDRTISVAQGNSLRRVAVSVKYKSLRVGEKSSTLKSPTSAVRRSRLAGAWVVSVRSRAI